MASRLAQVADGLLVALLALAFAAFIVGRTLISGVDVPGYASIVALLSFFSGVNMIGLGILGEYLGRVFTEVKRRPYYLIRDRLGFGEDAVGGRHSAGPGTEAARAA
jgi:polyisoprenyl-phosphate glycosyltransferase